MSFGQLAMKREAPRVSRWDKLAQVLAILVYETKLGASVTPYKGVDLFSIYEFAA